MRPKDVSGSSRAEFLSNGIAEKRENLLKVCAREDRDANGICELKCNTFVRQMFKEGTMSRNSSTNVGIFMGVMLQRHERGKG
jgi:hypothetical protein